MPHSDPSQSRSAIPRWVSVLAIASALAVLAGTVLYARHQLGLRVREQILTRDAVVLHEVMLLPESDSDLVAQEASLNDPANQVTALLRTSRLRGVLAARLLDAQGKFVQGFPINAQEADLASNLLPRLRSLQPVSRYHPELPLSSFLWLIETNNEVLQDVKAPILEVNVPLHSVHDSKPELKGIAQFLIDGHGVAAEFAQLENHLNTQALLAFGVSGTLLTLAVGYALHRLRHSNLLLQQRSRDLLQANQELLMAAKTSAIGAVTSHLLHGLRNPLAGLQSWVHSLPRQHNQPLEDWHEAVATTRRMQTMIQDIVQVLRAEELPSHDTFECVELLDTVQAQILPLCHSRHVHLRMVCDVQQEFLNARTAHLVRLILVNLGENAVQASPAHSTVVLQAQRIQGALEFTVTDQGKGLSPLAIQSLFQPQTSTTHREGGGAGIGLAISKQLANHLGASLELLSSSAHGTRFLLRLPLHATLAPQDSDRSSQTSALAD